MQRHHPKIPLKHTHTIYAVCSVWDKGYRYGFNSMEKDNEINVNGGSYDFGARIYDSRLGRWLSLDPLMAEYTSLSPYCGIGNNPILIIDPDGRKLIIDNGGVLLEYREGKLYSLDEVDDNGNYSKEYTPGEGEYAKKVLDNLSLLTNTPSGIQLVNDIVTNQKVINIKPSQIVNGKKLDNAHSNGSIYIDFNSTNSIPTQNGYTKTPAFIILGHEFAHAISFLYNKKNYIWVESIDDEGNDNSYGKDEVYATHVENKLRQENNMSLRTKYANDGQSDLLEGNTSKYVKVKIGVVIKPKEITGSVIKYSIELKKWEEVKYTFTIMVEEDLYRNYDYKKDVGKTDVSEEKVIIDEK
jgi:RHS repeat-associated protein